ncbi:MAG: MFS transporter [Cytophagales bacterium]|nr:MFS transporter [Cytophagales bacterium]
MKTAETIAQLLDQSTFQKWHFRIWMLSAAGIMLDGFDLFVIGLSLPFIQQEFALNSLQLGLIGSSAILGTILGAAFFGKLTDKYGRKTMYLLDMALLIFFSVLSGMAWDFWSLFIFRFFIGIGIGTDYPICATYVSEFMPRKIRGKMLISAFALQAVGILLASFTAFAVMKFYPYDSAWRWFLALGALPAGFILFFRGIVPESLRWLLHQGKIKKASRLALKLFKHEPKEKILNLIQNEKTRIETKPRFCSLFTSKWLRNTLLATLPWFFMDIATYGMGIFTPSLLTHIFPKKANASLNEHVFYAIESSLFLNAFLVLGFLANLFLIEKKGRIALQKAGFLGMFLGLLLLSIFYEAHASGTHLLMIFAGFILFNFTMNAGPNATTFVLSGELFPTSIRATGSGFAAGAAKIGATIGILSFSLLKDHISINMLMLLIGLMPLAGWLATHLFRIETKGEALLN